jgi:glyoxylase-like metal-dependent hydrolase (beta-lactamase superfamily II)
MYSINRRSFLQSTLGSVALGAFVPSRIAHLVAFERQAQDVLAQARAKMGALPITPTALADRLTLLSGPGGNVIVLDGADGKLLVDSFVAPAWPALQQALDTIGKAPVKLLVDTHWHFDHTDNNEHLHEAGAKIVAHANTKKRLGQTHDILGMHIVPSPAAAMPTETFTATHKLQMNGESIAAGYIPPAHTDSDIYVHFTRANVLHMGDVFFNGYYPFLDAATGGNINGQIAGANIGLKLADNNTKIVPGHGPLGDKEALTKYRDMLVGIRNRVQKLKASGKTLEEVTAAKPSADFDGTWGKGMFGGDAFVGLVYNTLK